MRDKIGMWNINNSEIKQSKISVTFVQLFTVMAANLVPIKYISEADICPFNLNPSAPKYSRIGQILEFICRIRQNNQIPFKSKETSGIYTYLHN